GPNPTRGVFRSRDGGRTWQKILFQSDSAGACDLAMDPANPRILYAGIWKAADGGDTWRELTRNPGLPRGTIGKVGLAVSAVNPDRVWALVEADSGGLFRSDDAGATWTRTSDDHAIRQRAWYFTHVVADPGNADGVYVLNVSLLKSA